MIATLLVAALGGLTLAQAPNETRLSDLDLSGIKQGYGNPQVDASVGGQPLRVAGRLYAFGVGTHAPSVWKLRLDGKASEFRASVGVQEYLDNLGVGSVEFIVRGDDRVLFRSGVMHGRDAAKPVKVDLTGIQELSLEVTDGGDGNSSDHADWLEAVIVHQGAPLPIVPPPPPFPPRLDPDGPKAPPNGPATVAFDAARGTLRLDYQGRRLFEGRLTTTSGRAALTQAVTDEHGAVTQVLTLSGTGLKLAGSIAAGPQTLAAETRGAAQERFPLIRTSHGVSRSRRNNVVYDRQSDWSLEAPADGSARLDPVAKAFNLTCAGDTLTLAFRPRTYQRHRNLPYYTPWRYNVREDSITGWCSWWAYMQSFRQSDLDALLKVWGEQRLAEFGYRFIQVDDCFQGDGGGRPETWLKWRKDRFPGGMQAYVDACRKAGCEPGVWLSSGFSDAATVQQHPDWFVQDASGKPFSGPWVGYCLDTTVAAAADTLAKPTFRGFHQAGFDYVKIDTLRHRLYDNLNHNPDYCAKRGLAPSDIFRSYLQTARAELGPDTFMLSCWGVLPEAIGIADACRIGGDGYGPVTMQQYNSFNGLVWRNDPDHCDVFPRFKPAQSGNVTKTDSVQAVNSETLIRPALASIAGCMLMLSDKPEVYRDAANLEGAKRAGPVLFSVPGQLYDYDASRSDRLRTVKREAIRSGAEPAPIDGVQFGAVCPWWLNEIDLPCDHWNVLHRLNWGTAPQPATTVAFADLGLDADRDYLVYEFWTRRFLGSYRKSVALPALGPQNLHSFAIRERLDRPQVVSTSRHLSQGGVDLEAMTWRGNTLSGRSRVIAGDRYELAIHVPAGFKVQSAQSSGAPVDAVADGELLRVGTTPTASGSVAWSVMFAR